MSTQKKETFTKYGIFLGVLLVAFSLMIFAGTTEDQNNDDLTVNLEAKSTQPTTTSTKCIANQVNCYLYSKLRTTYKEASCSVKEESCDNGCISTTSLIGSRCIGTCSNGSLIYTVAKEIPGFNSHSKVRAFGDKYIVSTMNYTARKTELSVYKTSDNTRTANIQISELWNHDLYAENGQSNIYVLKETYDTTLRKYILNLLTYKYTGALLDTKRVDSNELPYSSQYELMKIGSGIHIAYLSNPQGSYKLALMKYDPTTKTVTNVASLNSGREYKDILYRPSSKNLVVSEGDSIKIYNLQGQQTSMINLSNHETINSYSSYYIAGNMTLDITNERLYIQMLRSWPSPERRLLKINLDSGRVEYNKPYHFSSFKAISGTLYAMPRGDFVINRYNNDGNPVSNSGFETSQFNTYVGTSFDVDANSNIYFIKALTYNSAKLQRYKAC
ncbi:MAG TPA: hypothetical protein HA226_05010 [Nanoarchaeota archaeon]|nr:MAG: hypothetical protein QT09_C0002G0026 [archaeon GW2011_AR18]HIH26101.1 hypothetical protein [Nanoarchaeota archaeon]